MKGKGYLRGRGTNLYRRGKEGPREGPSYGTNGKGESLTCGRKVLLGVEFALGTDDG